MTKNKNKTVRVFAWLGAILLSAFLVFMPFFVKIRNNNVTYADTTTDVLSYEFNSSNFFTPIAYYQESGNLMSDSYNDVMLDFYFKFNTSPNDTPSLLLYYCPSFYNGSYENYRVSGSSWSNHIWLPYVYGVLDTNPYEDWFFDVYCSFDSGVTANFYKFDVISQKWGNQSTDIMVTDFRFYDTSDKQLFIQFLSRHNADDTSNHWKYSHRTYFYNTFLTDNQSYQQGVSDGYSDGYSDGDSNGYNRGYNTGYDVGESNGYNDGLQAGADVSFLNLIGATVDVPVKAFSGLFDFDVNMGGTSFNLKGFMLALLSVALVIAFIRIIMAK